VQTRIARRRNKQIIFLFFVLLLLIIGVTNLNIRLWGGGKDPYILIISKSSTTRDILQDKRDGCQYIKEEGKKLRPLVIDGKQVCVKGDE
jgi:hypothetical protein